MKYNGLVLFFKNGLVLLVCYIHKHVSMSTALANFKHYITVVIKELNYPQIDCTHGFGGIQDQRSHAIFRGRVDCQQTIVSKPALIHTFRVTLIFIFTLFLARLKSCTLEKLISSSHLASGNFNSLSFCECDYFRDLIQRGLWSICPVIGLFQIAKCPPGSSICIIWQNLLLQGRITFHDMYVTFFLDFIEVQFTSSTMCLPRAA